METSSDQVSHISLSTIGGPGWFTGCGSRQDFRRAPEIVETLDEFRYEFRNCFKQKKQSDPVQTP